MARGEHLQRRNFRWYRLYDVLGMFAQWKNQPFAGRCSRGIGNALVSKEAVAVAVAGAAVTVAAAVVVILVVKNIGDC